ncbi:MAG: MoxR family ATPase [Salinisphaera sp.]|jgi:MoxR-like ATPase|nr:MoxR family ATPase [Salinisphaera sp.]
MSHAVMAVRRHLAERLYGKDQAIRLALTCLLADGHLLIEDMPGVGKTTLAHSLAQTLGLGFARIQFTSDLLPSDILGVSVFDQRDATFHFRPGPIFTQIVLADEINRASPRTQSALLEAMAERQITVEGITRALARPFCVIATQNPVDHSGTFDLPNSQLDRFLMRIRLGYPPASAERRLLSGDHPGAQALQPVAGPDDLARWQAAVATVVTRDALVDYLLALVARTRDDNAFAAGLSPRAGVALRRAAQAWAFIDGRDHVVPEDVQTVLPAVVDHRIALRDGAGASASSYLLAQVEV